MARRNESKFASAALVLLLALVVLYGCRAFDPEPVIVNIPPDTFITGAPAETTGTVFNRHMYWYANDVDGEVVQYIFAITDSTVRDQTRPDLDEEDDRFDPADDILTLEQTSWRVVGYTEKSDSVFVFSIDREANTSKDITFHIVAVDDRGAIDPTPARLHFFNNSLGNPVVRFQVSTFDPDTGDEIERWVGTPQHGPKLSGVVLWPWAPDPDLLSPEDTPEPQIGFLNPFRICWEASSPNGMIVGYRYKASELQTAEYLPTKIDEETGETVPDWGLEVTCFDYQNNTNPADLDPGNLPQECASGWLDCPELRRWVSGAHRLQVVALDQAQVQSQILFGELGYRVNYPPETELVRDSDFPKFTTDGVNWNSFSEGDTLPDGAYVLFRQRGADRFARNLDDPIKGPLIEGLPCCDIPFSSAPPDSEVRYQVRVQDARAKNDQNADVFWKTQYSPAEYSDTLGFHIGPFTYDMAFRSQDEHETEDTTPDLMRFVGGFLPEMTGISPTIADSLIVRSPLVGGSTWPENTVQYSVNLDQLPPGLKRWWDGSKYVFAAEKGGPEWFEVQGHVIRYTLLFEGRADGREPNTHVASWTYEIYGQYDPDNRIKEGAGDDVFGRWESPGTDDRWEMSSSGDGVEIFIPQLIWISPQLFEPGFPYYPLGQLLARQLGRIQIRAQGKTTGEGDVFKFCVFSVREDCGANASTIQLGSLGRRTQTLREDFKIYLGLDPGNTGTITEYWPPEGYVPEEDL